MGNRTIKATGITAELARYFRDHVGQEVFLKDLAAEFPQYTTIQIQSNINNLNRTNTEVRVTTLIKGQSWTYRPKGKDAATVASKRIFEEIAVTKSGAIIVQDESGNLFKATELE